MAEVTEPEITDEQLDTPLRDPVDPDSPPDADLWRKRAKAYNSKYLGPAHWVWAINVVSATGSLAMAAREAGITVPFLTRRRERYPEFAAEILEALQYFREGTLERAAHRRAIDGVLEPVFYKGEEIGHVRKFSDTLLVKLLEGNMPEKYRSKADNSAPGAINITGGLPSADDAAKQEANAAAATPDP